MSSIKNLVTAEWLINNIALDNLKICDATYFLSTHNRDAEEEYVKEHIVNAIRFDIDAIKAPDSDLPHMLPTPKQFEKHMQQLGLRNKGIKKAMYPKISIKKEDKYEPKAPRTFELSSRLESYLKKLLSVWL